MDFVGWFVVAIVFFAWSCCSCVFCTPCCCLLLLSFFCCCLLLLSFVPGGGFQGGSAVALPLDAVQVWHLDPTVADSATDAMLLMWGVGRRRRGHSSLAAVATPNPSVLALQPFSVFVVGGLSFSLFSKTWDYSTS